MWLNGKLVAPSEARLDFLTPALHYGVAAFEGIRCYRTARGPAIFRLQDHVELRAGDYVYIPPDAAHLVMNRSGADATALVAHTAPSDQEGIVLLPELDALR